MARLYQSSSSIDNASKLTISLWLKISRDAINRAGEIRILEFGGPNDEEHVSSYISVREWDTNGYVDFSFVSELMEFPFDGDDRGFDNVTGGGGFVTGPPYIEDAFLPDWWTELSEDPIPQCGGVLSGSWYLPAYGFVGYINGSPLYLGIPYGIPLSFPDDAPLLCRFMINGSFYGFRFDEWNHIVIAIDGSVAQVTSSAIGEVTIDSTSFMFMSLNGVDKTYPSMDNIRDVKPSMTYDVRGSVMPRLFLPASTTTNGTGVETSLRWDQAVLDAEKPPKVRTIGPIKFQVSETEVAIPTQTSSDANTEVVDIGDIQIWVGKCIDPGNLTNFSKFVQVEDDGGGSPQPAEVAADAFGMQTLLFTGAPPDFLNNQGTGGEFSYSGSIDPLEGASY